ncbi:MAG: CtsR family transcriptional regulator [Acidaminococcaceae bacterium]
MRNLADVIENLIVRQLLAEQEDFVLVQRNELADQLSCAPSQISYVLSTRFTPERGYMVESRRGSGGFVRIVRVVPQENALTVPTSARAVLEHLTQNCVVTGREATLLNYMLELVEGHLDEAAQQQLLGEAVQRLAVTKK